MLAEIKSSCVNDFLKTKTDGLDDCMYMYCYTRITFKFKAIQILKYLKNNNTVFR